MALQSVNIAATTPAFNLTSKWFVEVPTEYGVPTYTTAPQLITKNVSFGVFLPANSVVKSAYIHSEWGTCNTGYAIKTVDGKVPDANGNVAVALDSSNGTKTFEFRFKPNGSMTELYVWKSATAQISDVYLHIEYEGEELTDDTKAISSSVSAGDSEQYWCKGTGNSGVAWPFTISGIPSGAVVTKTTLSFYHGYTTKAPGSTYVFWGSNPDGPTLYSKSGSPNTSVSVDITGRISGNGSYSLYLYTKARGDGAQYYSYFQNIKVTVEYTYYITIGKATAPTSVTINGSSNAYVKQNGTATLAWTGGSGGANNAMSGYKIYCNGSLYSTQGTGVKSLSIPANTAGTYLWTVRTACAEKDSADSTGVYCYSYGNPTAPTSVLVDPSTTVPGGEALLTWSGEADGINNSVKSFSIYRSETADGEKVWQASTVDRLYTVTAPETDGKAYYYTIVSVGVRESTYSPHSAQATLWAYEGEVFAPGYCTLDGATSHDPVTMSWVAANEDPYNPIAGYEIQYAESEDDATWSEWNYLGESETTTFAAAPSAIYGNWRKFRVRTKGAFGVSDWTECVNTLRREHIPFVYTDEVLTIRETPVKAVHMTELQTYANGLLSFYALGEEQMTQIVAGETSLGGWTEHVYEIRSAIDKIPASHTAWEDIPVNCPRASVIQQMRDVLMEVEKPAFTLGVSKLGAARL